ncbi:deoxyribonuclease TATDN1-like isoform X2 [Diabrotica virgifera virgifera]|nr:deoxyribonuclease TATDN1-like isoform X2 [Diabrotica virgifera virgifera]XP_050510401.1 deoxyribonuclease TATDN1-like isoform X2 [Diabrotica virgifera virgifera]XP_050510402.1 deoxyribonuclease TATDN1-like isoform X2 [Diabrotica virgifera virgifera]
MSTFKFIDVSANLTHAQYSGCYGHPPTKIHKADLQQVLERSWEAGLQRIIISTRDLNESIKGLKIAQSDKRLFCMIGCDYANSLHFEEKGETDLYIQQVTDVISSGKEKVVAIGECGLNSCNKYYYPLDFQLKYFKIQLQMSKIFKLPFILSLCGNDIDKLMLNELSNYPELRGVIYIFSPTVQVMTRFVEAGFYIGLDTWSFKSEETIEAVKIIPLDKIIFQTNCPNRIILRSFPGYWYISRKNLDDLLTTKKEKWRPDFMVNERSEPCCIRQILDMTALVTNMNKHDLAEQVYQNTMRLFFPGENN